jgi:hypothetical protein
MSKSSTDYTELAGLRITLGWIMTNSAPEVVTEWIKNRIKVLESK